MEGEGRQAGASAMMATERKRVACGNKKKREKSGAKEGCVIIDLGCVGCEVCREQGSMHKSQEC
jgi:hypothetical protein